MAAPDDWGEMTFGEVSGGESRARRTLRRSRNMYAAKTSAYETWGKDNILWLLFCELSKKQDLNCRLW